MSVGHGSPDICWMISLGCATVIVVLVVLILCPSRSQRPGGPGLCVRLRICAVFRRRLGVIVFPGDTGDLGCVVCPVALLATLSGTWCSVLVIDLHR